MLDPAFTLNQKLRTQLSNLVHPDNGKVAGEESCPEFRVTVAVSKAGADPDALLNVVVTGNEVSDRHGTGPLVKRVCQAWPNIFSIRARDDWGGVQDFGDWHVRLSPRATTRAGFFRNALSVLRDRKIGKVLCIPFLPDEFYTSIAVHECFGAKLCVYMMDDQNVAARNIPDPLMREFLERCSLRLATHPELQHIYQQKYGLPFHVLPAIVPGALVSLESPTTEVPRQMSKGALLGSFWDQSWFDRLCSALAGCGRKIDWFGNNKSPWFDLSPKTLANAGIEAHGIVPEDRLAQELAKYPFVIVPVGALDEKESNTGVARLSLPGRILFAAAASRTPVLIVGSTRTCGARFVAHFGIGEVVPYDRKAISAAMDRICEPESQERMREAAGRIAPPLSDRGVSEWLWESIELGVPADRRFENLFAGYDSTIDIESSTVATVAA
ncbi:MAG: hypothetical protein WBY44_26015 [Bryobacteraceae bacterium]